jgi:DNA-binding Xre family transcriptional regulator
VKHIEANNEINRVKGSMKSLVSQALDRTMFEFKISGAHLSRQSGVSQSQLSQFRTGKVDISTSNFVKIVRALPDQARRYYLNLVFNLTWDTALLPTMPATEMAGVRNLASSNSKSAASRSESGLVQFISIWLERNRVTKMEFELAIQQRTNLTVAKLQEILAGRMPSDTELGYLGMVLRDDNDQPFEFEYLQAICHQNPPHPNHPSSSDQAPQNQENKPQNGDCKPHPN